MTTNTVQLCSAKASFTQGEHIRRQNKEYEIHIYAPLRVPGRKLPDRHVHEQGVDDPDYDTDSDVVLCTKSNTD